MEDFIVYGNSSNEALNNLEKVLINVKRLISL